MINTNQKRKYLRVGTNLVATVRNDDQTAKTVYIKNVSATGAKIYSADIIANKNDLMNIKFKYKDVLYNLMCKITRTESSKNEYGVQFFYKNDSTNTTCTNKSNLNSDILYEYFDYINE